MPRFPKLPIKIFLKRLAIGLPIAFGLLAGVHPRVAPAAAPIKVAIVVSMAIRPYMDAVEGIQEELSKQSDATLELIRLEDVETDAMPDLTARLADGRFQTLIAIGPEAARFAWKDLETVQTILRFYTMVLNPESIVPENDLVCGIPLNIPVEAQIGQIRRQLPGIKRIGLLFDPENNQVFFRISAMAATAAGIEVVPIRVPSPTQLPAVLSTSWTRIDGLWLIPDRTVISESLVRYIAKAAIANRIPVIGYNRFFLESGAAMAMILDYRGIGRQTAVMVLNRLNGQPCRSTAPMFETVVDQRVLEKIGIDVEAGLRMPEGKKE